MTNPSKSEAIRRILEAVPEIRPAHAQAILAKEGIDITPDLFRVVKMNWVRDRRKQDEAERKYKEYWSPEAICRRAEDVSQEAEHRWPMPEGHEPVGSMSTLSDPIKELPKPALRCQTDGDPQPTPMPEAQSEVLRRLPDFEKQALLARVMESFDPVTWAKIVADYGDDRMIAEDIAQEYSYGLTSDEAVSRVVANLRPKPGLHA